MKRHILYILFAVAGAFALSCTEEKINEKEDLDSRTGKSEKLAVSYAVSGESVSGLSFTHNATVQQLEVNVNNENLYWNLESNRSWCKVVEGEHKGSGTVTLEIEANEGFDAREQATLTFVAGAFRSSGITVDQTATAFILSQPYFVAPLAGGAMTVKVTTLDGTSWQYEEGDWISVTEGTASSSGGFTTTTLTLTPSVNDDSSRYGRVELSSGAEKDYIYVYQFGTDLSYNDDGKIFFPSGEPASITLTAPSFTVKDVELPAYATGTVTEGTDGTATVTIEMEDNLSDCAEVRELAAALRLSNASATLVALPAIVQDYTPAYGLVTAAGLQAFAKAVKEGTSTSDWESEGVVRVLRDIDMNGVSGWEGIGTADHPFTGRFNGGGFSVINLKNTASGLFGFCKGATVENITLGKGCAIYNGSATDGEVCFGGVVSVAEGTTVSNCGVTAAIEYAGSSESGDTLYVGGVVGRADKASSIRGASMNGTLVLSTPSVAGSVYCCGGIAGLCEGSLTGSEVLGQVTYSSGIADVFIGGVQSKLVESATVANNSFMGVLTLGGSAQTAVAGGLYGLLEKGSFDSATDKSVSLGNIQVNSFRATTTTCIHVGGFAGKAAGGTDISFKGYESQTNIGIDMATAPLQGKYFFAGGFLGGCDVDAAVKSAAFSNLTNAGTISAKYSTATTCSVRRSWLGGIAGMVNGPCTFSKCVNNAEIGKTTGDVYCARSNAYNEIVGGIAGYVHGGNAEFADCQNLSDLENHLYNNNGVSNGTWEGMYTMSVVGGVLGAFNYYPSSTENFTLRMVNCSNGKSLFSYRGYTGGIVGYCYNASIEECTNLGRQANGVNDQCAMRGGIAGGAGNASVKNCTATGDITSMTYGSADFAIAGGIVGNVVGTEATTIDNCSYFGIIKIEHPGDKPEYPGGMVGRGAATTKVTGCRFGGSIQGVAINENNVGVFKNVIGNETGEVSGITYWSGNI